MRCLLRQVADGNMDSFHGALGRLDELDLGLAPLVAAQQPMRDHVEVAPYRSNRPDRFAQLGKFILRERNGMLDLLPDQRDDPTLSGMSGCLCQYAHTFDFMVHQSEPKLATSPASTG